MAYSQFMTARNSFASLGDSLASIQESVGQQSVDDQFQKQETLLVKAYPVFVIWLQRLPSVRLRPFRKG